MQHDSSTDAIIARAKREVTERQDAAIQQYWGKPWNILLPLLVVAILAVFLFVPAALPAKLLLAMGGVCGLRPSHSYFAAGVQLPMEARMVGIFAGFSLTLIPLLLLRRTNARRLGSRVSVAVLTLFFASMVFDGVNSTLYEFGYPHLYTPNNPLRLLTGLLSGVAVAPFLTWFVGSVAVPAGNRSAITTVRAVWEPFVMLLPIGLFAALVMSEMAVAYLPATLLSVGGIVLVMALAILALLIFSSPLRGRTTRWQQLVTPGALALLVAFAVLAISSYLRWSNVGNIAFLLEQV